TTLPFHGVIASLAVSPDYATDRTLVFGAARGDLQVSRDAGASWEAVAVNVPGTVQQVVFSPGWTGDGTLLLRCPPDRLLASTDRGRTFTALAAPPDTLVPGLLPAEDYATSGTLW